MANTFKRGETVTIFDDTVFWSLRTEQELQALRDKDAAEGRWHDDGGEPILYSAYNRHSGKNMTIKCTSKRAEWVDYRRKPKGLCTGFCEELNREVLFQKGTVK